MAGSVCRNPEHALEALIRVLHNRTRFHCRQITCEAQVVTQVTPPIIKSPRRGHTVEFTYTTPIRLRFSNISIIKIQSWSLFQPSLPSCRVWCGCRPSWCPSKLFWTKASKRTCFNSENTCNMNVRKWFMHIALYIYTWNVFVDNTATICIVYMQGWTNVGLHLFI